jgi:hypothetical protein
MKTSLVIASSLLVSAVLALAQTSVLYQEDWGSTKTSSKRGRIFDHQRILAVWCQAICRDTWIACEASR